MERFLKNTEKMNAPTFAYYAANGESKFISGHYANHTCREINGIMIDNQIPKEYMMKLLTNPKIEMRSSCEGSDLYGPFFIFRLIDGNKPKIDKLCYLMNSGTVYTKIICKYGKGRQGEYRIVVTAPFTKGSVDKKEYIQWWAIATKKLITILNKI